MLPTRMSQKLVKILVYMDIHKAQLLLCYVLQRKQVETISFDFIFS